MKIFSLINANIVFQIISSLCSFALGAFVTWLVSRRYYKKAADELKAETEKTRTLIRISLRALESAGLVELTHNKAGKITGIIHQGYMKASVVSSMAIKGNDITDNTNGTE